MFLRLVSRILKSFLTWIPQKRQILEITKKLSEQSFKARHRDSKKIQI